MELHPKSPARGCTPTSTELRLFHVYLLCTCRAAACVLLTDESVNRIGKCTRITLSSRYWAALSQKTMSHLINDRSVSMAFRSTGQESPLDRAIREIRLLLMQYSASTTTDADRIGLFISLVRTYLAISDLRTGIHDTMDVNGIFEI